MCHLLSNLKNEGKQFAEEPSCHVAERCHTKESEHSAVKGRTIREEVEHVRDTVFSTGEDEHRYAEEESDIGSDAILSLLEGAIAANGEINTNVAERTAKENNVKAIFLRHRKLCFHDSGAVRYPCRCGKTPDDPCADEIADIDEEERSQALEIILDDTAHAPGEELQAPREHDEHADGEEERTCDTANPEIHYATKSYCRTGADRGDKGRFHAHGCLP